MSDSAKTPPATIRTVARVTPTFHAIEVVVADMAASLAFYRLLGVDLPADAEREPHVEGSLPGGPRVMFDTRDTIRSFDASWSPPSGGHALGMAFTCNGPADVDATHDALVVAGHRSHLAPWDAFWGMRYAVVLDPDGNTVDLFAPLPTT
jgi:catechol 2,3-dioxygenase-like lactoylglutathione lyase family enzyme